MPSTPGDAVSVVRAAVRRSIRAIGAGVVGVACSGGADSMTLLDAAIAGAGAANVVAITIDHGLVPTSVAACARVAAWARGQGAGAIVRAVVVTPRASLEAAARDARYAALEAVADELGLVAILVGHTARDQAETVVLRLLRGTGPAGLAAMPPRRGRIVRPLLAVDRAMIDAYVARLAAATAEWVDAIDAVAAPLATETRCQVLAAQPAAIRKRALAIALDRAAIDFGATHLEALDHLVCAPAHGEVAIDLPGARVIRTYDTLHIAVMPISPAPTGVPPIIAPAGHYLRTWRPGDRMRLARLHGRSRKLSDLFTDAKVPRNLRARAVVMVRTADDSIVWVEHLSPANPAEWVGQ
ncbi:MAG: tRNA lysidine(34) synthetase TilS [Proteobacteria bacterium]|nr:tRNA lysidine(34) synthetase TilS [Pseudomonadota bacterium]